MAEPYIAAVYSHVGKEWCLTSSASDVIDAPDDEVIFATTLDELEQMLIARNPGPRPDLAHDVTAYGNRGRVSSRWSYTGQSIRGLLEMLAGDEDLNCDGLSVSDKALCSHLQHHGLEYGLIQISAAWGFRYRYVPKEAGTILRRRAYQAKRTGITIHDVRKTHTSFWLTVRKHIRVESASVGSWADVVNTFAYLVSIFNLLFGKNAHRAFRPFQDLIDKWVAADKLGRQRLHEVADPLACWLDEEAKIKKRPPAREKWDMPKGLIRPYP